MKHRWEVTVTEGAAVIARLTATVQPARLAVVRRKGSARSLAAAARACRRVANRPSRIARRWLPWPDRPRETTVTLYDRTAGANVEAVAVHTEHAPRSSWTRRVGPPTGARLAARLLDEAATTPKSTVTARNARGYPTVARIATGVATRLTR